MKRGIALALAALLLACAGLAHAAQAESRGSIRLIDIGPRDYWKENGIAKTDVSYDPWGDSLALLQGEDAADLMVLRTYNDDFTAFADAGLLADLSGSETIREAVSRMTPAVQAFITTEDGRILALPHAHYEQPFYWLEDAWQAAGLTQADVPQSYTGLLDFLEKWIARIEREPEKEVCVSSLLYWNTGKAQYNDCYWLIEALLTSWETQQRYAGEPVHFGTAEFAALAERSREIGLALHKAEPGQQKRENMLQLFQNDIRGGKHANDGRDYGFSHTVPMRITEDQPELMGVDCDLYVVRSGSPWLDEAIGFLESELQNDDWRRTYGLYADFPAGVYDGCTIAQGWLDDCRDYAGEMVYYPHIFHIARGAETGKESLMMKFFEGKISAQEMAEGFDRLIGYAPQT